MTEEEEEEAAAAAAAAAAEEEDMTKGYQQGAKWMRQVVMVATDCLF